ncbi:hypothetical protein DEU56DRAFT_750617 [Suillus clintonianus]|uniref:uncharacterized protein n=1 Tax=Suillus clintonianus TaxID=1904413 RepID=UPI001B87B8D8|nr:uncharacterized protein DEU56DRAFT_750617 [Suillus clintonianus]KAG2157547.1 hypothetical protein DEU56DRAFT_750617 [Suillus clintonianus]
MDTTGAFMLQPLKQLNARAETRTQTKDITIKEMRLSRNYDVMRSDAASVKFWKVLGESCDVRASKSGVGISVMVAIGSMHHKSSPLFLSVLWNENEVWIPENFVHQDKPKVKYDEWLHLINSFAFFPWCWCTVLCDEENIINIIKEQGKKQELAALSEAKKVAFKITKLPMLPEELELPPWASWSWKNSYLLENVHESQDVLMGSLKMLCTAPVVTAYSTRLVVLGLELILRDSCMIKVDHARADVISTVVGLIKMTTNVSLVDEQQAEEERDNGVAEEERDNREVEDGGEEGDKKERENDKNDD